MESMETPDSRRIDSTTLVDLRKKPRYATQFPGEVISENGDRAYVTITNLSQSGLRVEGSKPSLASLLPHMNHNSPHTPVSLQVCFSVPGPADQSSDIRVQCKSVYVLLGDHRNFKIGMQFIAFDEGNDALMEYISFRASKQ